MTQDNADCDITEWKYLKALNSADKAYDINFNVHQTSELFFNNLELHLTLFCYSLVNDINKHYYNTWYFVTMWVSNSSFQGSCVSI